MALSSLQSTYYSYAPAPLPGLQSALGSSAFISNAPSCDNAQLSCHNTSVVENLCCFNYPGGKMLSTQFWDTGSSATGPDDVWTLHGLWPDHCDGSFEAYCDPSRNYRNITAILDSFDATDLLSTMSKYWKDYQGNDENLWFHEWAKHGTCVSTLTPSCYGPSYTPQEEVVDYFRSAVIVYQALPTYQWLLDAGIVPSTSVTYSRDAIQTALRQRHGADVSLGCKANKFDEVWYHFDVKGSVQTGQFVASIPDGGKTTCPELGIRYPPKRSSGGDGRHSTHVGYPTRTSGPMPTGTGAPFQGKGVLNVITQDDGQRGCIISGGTWYVSGTCAKFTATPLDKEVKQDGKSFTLRSNKGDCAIVKDALICANHVRNPSTFSTNAHGLLSFGGNTTFFADQVPRGWKQVPVYVEPSQHRTSLTIEWSHDW